MSRFDVLCADFKKWREDAWAVQIAWRRLPYALASAVRVYLGAPEMFNDISISEKSKENSYVTPADATWNDATSSFDLSASISGAMMRDFDLNKNDGRYYFGLVIYLESGPNTFPKQPFWFLLSVGWIDNGLSQLRIHITKQDYLLSTKNYSMEDLEPVCASIEQLLRSDLSVSPFARRDGAKALPASETF